MNGLTVSNHLLGLLHLPAYGGLLIWALMYRRIRGKDVLYCMLAFLAGAALYGSLIIREVVNGMPVSRTIQSALWGVGFEGQVLNFSFSPIRQVIRSLEYFILNFPTPLILLAPVGIIAAQRSSTARWFAPVGGGIFLVNYFFAFRYSVVDQYVFFFGCYILFAAFAGIGVAALIRGDSRRSAIAVVLALLPVVVYEVGPDLIRRSGIEVPFRQDLPHRDAYAYFLRPRMNGDNGAEQMARSALSRAAPDGLVVADYTVNNALAYVRDVMGVEPRVTLIDTTDVDLPPPVISYVPESVRPFALRGRAFAATNSADYLPRWLSDHYQFVPAGDVYQLLPRQATADSEIRTTSDTARRNQ